jgi:Protein of unknown function (DUF2752)
MKSLPRENAQAKRADRFRHCTIRLAFIIGAPAVLLILRSVDPVRIRTWLPFPISCGAVTGLPCIFCGMTRALHVLLNGDVGGAIYFNWLVFPFLGSVVFVVFVCIIEVTKRRTILNWDAVAPITVCKLTIIGSGLFFLWTLQVYLALSQHKHELLNPSGPLYALFVQ